MGSWNLTIDDRDYDNLVRDSVSVATRCMNGIHPSTLAFYIREVETIFLREMSVTCQNVQAGFYGTLNHEYMHKILHKLEDGDTCTAYDMIANMVDDVHEGLFITTIRDIYPNHPLWERIDKTEG